MHFTTLVPVETVYSSIDPSAPGSARLRRRVRALHATASRAGAARSAGEAAGLAPPPRQAAAAIVIRQRSGAGSAYSPTPGRSAPCSDACRHRSNRTTGRPRGLAPALPEFVEPGGVAPDLPEGRRADSPDGLGDLGAGIEAAGGSIAPAVPAHGAEGGIVVLPYEPGSRPVQSRYCRSTRMISSSVRRWARWF